MRHLKMLGLTAMTAAALLAFAGHASATTFTSPAGTIYNGEVNVTSVGHINITNPIATIKCSLVFGGNVESQGAGTVPVVVGLTSFIFTGCTNSWHVTTVTPGKFTIYGIGPNKGRMFSNGTTFEATRLGVICRYTTKEKVWADITGGAPATIFGGGSFIFHSGSALCGSETVPWEGNLEVTGPNPLTVDE